MTLRYGIRPFDFQDFFQMIVNGKLDITKVDYSSIVKQLLRKENFFTHYEITADLAYVLPDFLTPNEISKLKELPTSDNFTSSVHLPLWAIEPASPNKYIQEASIKCLIEAIELTKPLDPMCWVMHATGALIAEFDQINFPDSARNFMTLHFVDIAQQSIQEILSKTNIPSHKLAVENVEFPFKVMMECIENLNLGICFDTGHLLAGYSGEWKNGVLEFYETYQDRIIEIHLHDGRYPRIDHKILGTLDLPVKRFLEALLNNDFKGPLVFELTYKEVMASLEYIRKIVPEAL